MKIKESDLNDMNHPSPHYRMKAIKKRRTTRLRYLFLTVMMVPLLVFCSTLLRSEEALDLRELRFRHVNARVEELLSLCRINFAPARLSRLLKRLAKQFRTLTRVCKKHSIVQSIHKSMLETYCVAYGKACYVLEGIVRRVNQYIRNK